MGVPVEVRRHGNAAGQPRMEHASPLLLPPTRAVFRLRVIETLAARKLGKGEVTLGR